MSDGAVELDELVRAAGGSGRRRAGACRSPAFRSTRARLQPGEVFVALRDERDGHEFVLERFRSRCRGGARLERTIRAKPGDGALLRVARHARGLRSIARAARAAHRRARIVAVTGSVGKTGTKEALRACLSRIGPTHAAEKSFNNHWGVPLTLARMPADAALRRVRDRHEPCGRDRRR